LGIERDASATVEGAADTKSPRTERGRRTLRALLDAASQEFGERGFHDASISSITQRAGVALGSFYSYFNSKEEIFRALVLDMSRRVKEHVAPHVLAAPEQLAAEQAGLRSFIEFVRAHKEIYRIIDEAEFVDAASWRDHYAGTAERIRARLVAGAARGEVQADVGEVHAWAIMGMNVFLGLRYGVWSETMSATEVAAIAGRMLAGGLRP
jgi:AcrR family transcriptional regulator